MSVTSSAVLGGIGSSITLFDPQAFDALRLWLIGSVAGRDRSYGGNCCTLQQSGLAIALAAARSLGADVLRADILVLIAVILLSGTGTVAAGAIGFVGLILPHVARWFTGPDRPWAMVFAALGDRRSFLLNLRALGVSADVVALAHCIASLSLASGTYTITFTGVAHALGRGDRMALMIITECAYHAPPLPCFSGRAGLERCDLPVSDAQSVGSHDILGFACSYTGALGATLLLSRGYCVTAVGALVGGIVTEVPSNLLACRRGV